MWGYYGRTFYPRKLQLFVPYNILNDFWLNFSSSSFYRTVLPKTPSTTTNCTCAAFFPLKSLAASLERPDTATKLWCVSTFLVLRGNFRENYSLLNEAKAYSRAFIGIVQYFWWDKHKIYFSIFIFQKPVPLSARALTPTPPTSTTPAAPWRTPPSSPPPTWPRRSSTAACATRTAATPLPPSPSLSHSLP